MLVSVALFSVVIVIVAAAYLNLVNLDNQTRATNDLVNNLNFAVDTMARSIRTGTSYNCDTVSPSDSFHDCTTIAGTGLSFVNDQGTQIGYVWNTSTHQLGECTAGAVPCTAAAATYFTDPRISITTMKFYVSGNDKTLLQQPQVVLVIKGTLATDPSHPIVSFDIQTTAVQRGVNI